MERHIANGPVHTVSPNVYSAEFWVWTQGHVQFDGNAFSYLSNAKLIS